jgi:hypothetical protein
MIVGSAFRRTLRRIMKAYLLSLPERLVRSVLGLGADKQTLDDLQKEGFATYASRQLRPYVRAARRPVLACTPDPDPANPR